MLETKHGLAGSVDVDLPLDRIDDPAELRAVLEVLLKLCLQVFGGIIGRAQLHDKVGTDRRETLPLLGGEPLPPGASHPREVRSALGAVGQCEAGAGVEAFAAT